MNTQQLTQQAKKYIGISYVYGGNSRKGYDCSAFVQTVFLSQGYLLPRTAAEQMLVGTPITKDTIEAGDLLFFTKNPFSAQISHVAIALGNGKMIHASRHHHRIVISNLNLPYFQKHLFAARRLFANSEASDYDSGHGDLSHWRYTGLLCSAETVAQQPAL